MKIHFPSAAQKLLEFGARTGSGLGRWMARSKLRRRAQSRACSKMPITPPAFKSDCDGPAISRFAAGRELQTVYAWGDPAGQPYVLLSHGWSSGATQFAHWVRPLQSAGYSVVCLDHVGHGQSSGRNSGLADFVNGLHLIGERLGPAAAVIGHGLGGTAAMLALAQGLIATRAILIAPVADPMATTKQRARSMGLADSSSAANCHDQRDASQQCRLYRTNAKEAAPVIGRPVLIVHDLEDREVPWSDGASCARYWRGARLLTTTQLGHDRIVDDPSVIASAVSFVSGEDIGQPVISSPNLPDGFA